MPEFPKGKDKVVVFAPILTHTSIFLEASGGIPFRAMWETSGPKGLSALPKHYTGCKVFSGASSEHRTAEAKAKQKLRDRSNS